MIWSFTDSRTFAKCQRRWYYDAMLGYWNQKDPCRWEAYLLSKLQSVSAWRGQVVDLAITTTLVPTLNARQAPSLRRCLDRARQIFDTQRTFAMRHRLREAGMVPSQHKDSFAAFLSLEYQQPVEETELAQAWSEVEQAITNLFGMDALLGQLRAARLCVAQRALTFKHEGVSVKAVPDLIAFYDDRPPLIVDWKVHAFGTKDYWLQLVTYALALTRCTVHKDFARVFQGCDPTTIRLAEVQLLTNRIREHTLDEDDVGEVEDMIADSASRMSLALDGRKHPELRQADFPATSRLENCSDCPFRKPCWEGDE
ncbi:MAG: PD-(D/E)XK nuclease family protein [Planctomycetes bacterium]|nr:PD-(D/E)XK nuclease family protein [Planctomycetota bacterium]